MTGGQDCCNCFKVVLYFLQDSLVSGNSRDSHLLVNLGTEAWDEGFKDRTQEVKCIYSSEHNLGLSLRVSLSKCPRLGILEVEVTFRAVLHSNSQTVLEFNLLHQFNVLGEVIAQVGDEFSITTVPISFVSWQYTFVRRGKEFKGTITEIT